MRDGFLRDAGCGVLMTLEKVEVLRYGPRRG